ncbi:MAG: hypothetical protein WD267_04300 [Balneolales bacterium]
MGSRLQAEFIITTGVGCPAAIRPVVHHDSGGNQYFSGGSGRNQSGDGPLVITIQGVACPAADDEQHCPEAAHEWFVIHIFS